MQITLHLPTAAITVAIGSLALFGMSASAPQGPATDRDVQAFEDVGQPDPDDLVWIYRDPNTSDPTYTVPAGRKLVLTGITAPSGGSVRISIDGGANRYFYPIGQTSLFSGISLMEGQSINLSGSTGFHISLLGYLVDA